MHTFFFSDLRIVDTLLSSPSPVWFIFSLVPGIEWQLIYIGFQKVEFWKVELFASVLISPVLSLCCGWEMSWGGTHVWP